MSDTLKILDLNREQGIRTEVHEEDGRVVIQKSYDAEPFVEVAAERRALTRSDRWNELGTHVGFVPMAELATMFRQDGGLDQKRLREFLQKNPAFVTFEKFLKR